ncbi:GNAT family N-acetyltransferase [Marinimicrobium sp. ABcell2]|uniref:GNAT family N-acetyltransferase n=1 Tax=Marinimicrobium sp. ABcell2 TaxID=3069751 RepID=UPI00359C2E1A
MIREANASDYDAMDNVFRVSAKAFCSRSYACQVIASWAGEPWPDRFLKSKESGDEQYVFTLEGKVVCFGSVNLGSHKLVSLFVSPEHSGKSIGQSMLEFLVARAESSGIPALKLDSSLNAVSFYERHGFTEIGRSMYRTKNGVEMESVQMEQKLCP